MLSCSIRLQAYREQIHPILPVINIDKLSTSDGDNYTTLEMAAALMGATAHPYNDDFQTNLYKRIQMDLEATTLEGFQTLLLLLYWELVQDRLSSAWMRLGQLLRLAQLLGFFTDWSSPNVTSTRPSVTEEYARSFWGLYILETHLTLRLDVPGSIRDDTISVPLPSVGEPNERDVSAALSLHTPLDVPTPSPISDLAGWILVSSAARRCHLFTLNRRGSATCESGFWDEYYGLTRSLKELRQTLHLQFLSSTPHTTLSGNHLWTTEAYMLSIARKQMVSQNMSGLLMPNFSFSDMPFMPPAGLIESDLSSSCYSGSPAFQILLRSSLGEGTEQQQEGNILEQASLI